MSAQRPDDTGPSPPPDLDEEIALLTRLREDPVDGTDPAEVAGPLGMALLDRFDEDGSVGTLSTAIDSLHEAVVAGAEHPGRPAWCFHLGVAYAERAERCGHLADFDLALWWIGQARAGLPPADPDRDLATVTLAEVSADRYRARREAGTCDETTIRDEIDQLITTLAGLVATDPEAVAQLGVLRGLAHLDRFDLAGGRDDLDRGIQELARALPALPPEIPGRGFADALLVDAYRLRAMRAGGGTPEPDRSGHPEPTGAI